MLDQRRIGILQLNDNSAEIFAIRQIDREIEAAKSAVELRIQQVLAKPVHLAGPNTASTHKGKDEFVVNDVRAAINPPRHTVGLH